MHIHVHMWQSIYSSSVHAQTRKYLYIYIHCPSCIPWRPRTTTVHLVVRFLELKNYGTKNVGISTIYVFSHSASAALLTLVSEGHLVNPRKLYTPKSGAIVPLLSCLLIKTATIVQWVLFKSSGEFSCLLSCFCQTLSTLRTLWSFQILQHTQVRLLRES